MVDQALQPMFSTGPSEIQAYVSTVDITNLLPAIRVPTLVITGQSTVLASVDEFESWQKSIPDSRLVVIPFRAYHLAAVSPSECISALFDFLGDIGRRQPSSPV